MVVENNGENSGPLTLLPVDRLTATDCNADRSCQKAHLVHINFNINLHIIILMNIHNDIHLVQKESSLNLHINIYVNLL